MPSWSSPSPISRMLSSIPLLATPRISPTFSTAPVAGITLPGGANTASIPVRAFGAPHTTDTGPSPASTEHTRSRSALGCCTASITRAMRNSASAAPGSSTPSSSSPISVSRAVIASSPASVSRYVRSQLSENFMPRPHAAPRGPAG